MSSDTSEALAVAGGLPVVDPHSERPVLGLELLGLEPLPSPYSANSEHNDGTLVTTGLAQFNRNHWAIFNDGSAAILWANFLAAQVRDGSPGELGGDFP